MRLINLFGKNLSINEDNETVSSLSCYRRTCYKCKEIIPAVSSNSSDHTDMTPSGSFLRINTVEVHPVVVRKTPKFPTRERHLAIKRKKSLPQMELEKHRAAAAASVGDTDCENGK